MPDLFQAYLMQLMQSAWQPPIARARVVLARWSGLKMQTLVENASFAILLCMFIQLEQSDF